MADTDFVTTWETTSASESITIPFGDAGTYNCTIDWGDGSADNTITSYNDSDLTHTYADADTYTVTISGTAPWLYFNNGGDKLKIKSITQWGTLGWVSCEKAFYGCTNLTSSATDAPDIGNVVSFRYMFYGCTAFNQDIGSWDVSSGTDFSYMFYGCTLSTTNYNALLVGWAALTLNSGMNFHGGNSTYFLGGAAEAAHTSLIDDDSWTITDGGGIMPTRTADKNYTTFADHDIDASTLGDGATIYVEYEITGDTTDNCIFEIGAGTANDRVFVDVGGGNLTVTTGGVAQVAISGSVPTIARHRIAARLKDNDVALYRDGVQIGTDTSCTVSDVLTKIYHGMYYTELGQNAKVLYDERLYMAGLTNDECAELTTL